MKENVLEKVFSKEYLDYSKKLFIAASVLALSSLLITHISLRKLIGGSSFLIFTINGAYIITKLLFYVSKSKSKF